MGSGSWQGPVRKARGNVADVQDAADIFLYPEASIAPSLDMRRRFKAVMDVLGAMIRSGISLSRSVELTAQWDRILALGPLHPVTLDDLSLDRGMDIDAFYHAASGVHHRLSDFIHAVVVYRRDEATWEGRNWIREDPMVHPYRWLRPELVPPEPRFTPGGSGVLSDPARIDEEFRKAWLPYFCRSGQRDTSLEEFDHEVEGWLPLLPKASLPWLIGQMLADVVQREGATAGGLDGWDWRELKVLPVSSYDELARILTKVEDFGVWYLDSVHRQSVGFFSCFTETGLTVQTVQMLGDSTAQFLGRSSTCPFACNDRLVQTVQKPCWCRRCSSSTRGRAAVNMQPKFQRVSA